MRCFYFWHKWRKIKAIGFAYDAIIISRCDKCDKIKKKTLSWSRDAIDAINADIAVVTAKKIDGEITKLISQTNK